VFFLSAVQLLPQHLILFFIVLIFSFAVGQTNNKKTAGRQFFALAIALSKAYEVS
jgi:hypothetical protein